ncbi:MAG: hypothetical protein ACKPKO_14580 [Candidatus Fonsibacter sp.]
MISIATPSERVTVAIELLLLVEVGEDEESVDEEDSDKEEGESGARTKAHATRVGDGGCTEGALC